MIMQKWDIGFGNFELEFLFKISRKLNLMESQRYLFHVLKGKFPLLSRKARDEECYFFLFFFFSIYIHSQNFLYFLSLLVELPQSNVTSAQCQGSSSSSDSATIHQDQMAASPQCTSWEWTLLTHHGAKPIVWSCPPAPGPLWQIPSFRGWHLPVILVFWVLTQCFEWTSVTATPLGLIQTLQKQRWKHVLVPPAACSTWEASAFPLGCWTAVTKGHLVPFSLWSITSIPSSSLWIPSSSGIPLDF